MNQQNDKPERYREEPRTAGEILAAMPELTAKGFKTEEEIAAHEKARRAAEIASRRDMHREVWNLDSRYANCQPEPRAGWFESWKLISSKLGLGAVIGIAGGRGNGKTQLGAEAMKYVTARGRSAYYASVLEFLNDIKATYGQDARERERDVQQQYQGYRLLVLDEVGMRIQNDWGHQQLFEMLNRRYGRQVDTILIGSQSVEQFCADIGDSLVSRMQENGCLINCTWESFRRPAA